MAADDTRRQEVETQSATQKRKSTDGNQSAKKKRRRNEDQTDVYQQRKAQMEIQMRKEEMHLKKVQIDLEHERQKLQREQQDNLMSQQGNMIKVMTDQQWRSQPDNLVMMCKYLCVYRPCKQSISKEMNNVNFKICIALLNRRAGFATADQHQQQQQQMQELYCFNSTLYIIKLFICI